MELTADPFLRALNDQRVPWSARLDQADKVLLGDLLAAICDDWAALVERREGRDDATLDRYQASIYAALGCAARLGYTCGVDSQGYAHIALPTGGVAFWLPSYTGPLGRPHRSVVLEAALAYRERVRGGPNGLAPTAAG